MMIIIIETIIKLSNTFLIFDLSSHLIELGPRKLIDLVVMHSQNPNVN